MVAKGCSLQPAGNHGIASDGIGGSAAPMNCHPAGWNRSVFWPAKSLELQVVNSHLIKRTITYVSWHHAAPIV
jgi:hypothetical protein